MAKKKGLEVAFLLLLILFLSPLNTFAVKEYTWDGSESDDWDDDDNWDTELGQDLFIAAQVYIIPTVGGNDNPVIRNAPDNRIDYIDLAGGQLTIDNTTFSLSNDVAIYNGADFIVTNGASVTTSEDLHVYDAGSTVTVSGGSLTISGNLYLGLQHPNRGDNTNGTPTFTISGGAVTVAGAIVFDDAEGDTPLLEITSGSLIANGGVRSDGAAVNINYSGGTFDINGDLEMDGSGDTFTMSNSVNLTVSGNWTNSGTLTQTNNNTITFDGSSQQSITNTGGETFTNWTINNANGVLLNDPVTITNQITLTSGIITAATTNDMLTINSGVSFTGGASRYVDGPIRKVGNTTFTFPTGDGGVYQPITISAPSSATDHFTAQYFALDPDGSYNIANRESGIERISGAEYWILDRTNGGSSVSVTIGWTGNSDVGQDPGDTDDLLVVRWNGSTWVNEGGTVGSNSITAGPIASFSPFTLGSSSGENPLPVELISFDASLVDNKVLLEWSTATERVNSHFEVRKSSNGVDEEVIGEVYSKGINGNSDVELNYSFVDKNLSTGFVYYRLKQVDFDGAFEFSNFAFVEIDGEDGISSRVYPNPSNGGELFINAISSVEPSTVQIIDLNGRNISIDFTIDELSDIYRIVPNSILKPGLYLLQFRSKKDFQVTESHTFMVQ
ncbi:MAG: T9SS type A sorting domain-containing protein [Cyclobacteriaceae bacterium]